MFWGLYNRINIDFAYLIWEDFVYQPSISRHNRIHWHYVRDDALFSTIKVLSRHQATQQYGAILPIELTTNEIRNSKAYQEYYAYAMGEATPKPKATQQYGAILPIELTTNEIRNSKAYQEYYACAMGEAAPKPKASARKKKGDSASSTTTPTPTPTTTAESAPRLSASAKGKRPLRATTPVEPTDLQRTEAEQLKIALKWSRQETQISQQQSGSVQVKELVLNQGFRMYHLMILRKNFHGNLLTMRKLGKDSDEDDDEDDDDDDEEEETAKDDEELKETGTGGDDVRESG
nr:hypothetical protein [Tanacetum cinerariifolium]